MQNLGIIESLQGNSPANQPSFWNKKMNQNSDFSYLANKMTEVLGEFSPRDAYEVALLKEHADSLREFEEKILESGENPLTFEDLVQRWEEVAGIITMYRQGLLNFRIRNGKLEQRFSEEARDIFAKAAQQLLVKDKKEMNQREEDEIANLGSSSLNLKKKKGDELLN